MLAGASRRLGLTAVAQTQARRFQCAVVVNAQKQPAPTLESTSVTSPTSGPNADVIATTPSDVAVPSGARSIAYKGPLDEDIEGSARYATSVGMFWSNIPNHVRASFKTVASTDEAPKPAAPLVLDGVVARAKAWAASTGMAPQGWGAPEPYYGGQIPLAPYRRGQTAAYHYPPVLVPRELAHRFPLDMYVDPVFQTSDAAQRLRMRGTTLFPRLQGKVTLMMIFSGQPLSGLWTGLRQWLDATDKQFLDHPKTQVFKLHCEESWFSRRTHVLTKFHLRRQVDESELFKTFVYHGKWKWEYVRALHLYNRELPVTLLVDAQGYIRWHAVGLPTEDATATFTALAWQLLREKRAVV